MPELLAAALAFPTVIYTILLVVIVVYWSFVVLGALDIDMLDIGDADGMLEGGADGAAEGIADGAFEGAGEALDGALDGAADGAAEALDGAFEGAGEALDGAFDGAADGLADGAADGLADGAADGLADGAADGAGDADLDVAGGGLAQLLSALKLRSAPMTVVISSVVLTGWALSMLGMYYLGGLLPRIALVPLVGLGAFVVAVPFTSLIIRPLAPVFVGSTGRTRSDVLGNTAVVTTGRVDERFGLADCKVGGDFLRIEVRAKADKGIGRGQTVLVIDYDREREAYLVEPLDD